MAEIEKERLRNAVGDLVNLHDTENWDLGDRILREVIEKLDFEDLKSIVRKNSGEIAMTIQRLSNGNISYMEVIEEPKDNTKAQHAELLTNLALALWVSESINPDENHEDQEESCGHTGEKRGRKPKKMGISMSIEQDSAAESENS